MPERGKKRSHGSRLTNLLTIRTDRENQQGWSKAHENLCGNLTSRKTALEKERKKEREKTAIKFVEGSEPSGKDDRVKRNVGQERTFHRTKMDVAGQKKQGRRTGEAACTKWEKKYIVQH